MSDEQVFQEARLLGREEFVPPADGYGTVEVHMCTCGEQRPTRRDINDHLYDADPEALGGFEGRPYHGFMNRIRPRTRREWEAEQREIATLQSRRGRS